MALGTGNKLYISLGVLAVLAVALYFQQKARQEEKLAYTPEVQQADLPKVSINDEAIKKIDKVVIKNPGKSGDDKDQRKPEEVELVKKGDEWRVSKPVDAKANQANVKSLLDNLKSLEVKEQIASGTGSYKQYELEDAEALHATFYAGDKPEHEFYFGSTGGRGQMVRFPKQDGVYAVKGYSSYLYSRDIKGWRDLEIFKFESKDVTNVEVDNEHGHFVFVKDGDEWTAKFKAAKALAASSIKDFEKSKVDDMLRSYASLNASGFGTGEKPEETGLEEPEASVVISLKDGAKRELRVGKKQEGSNRWAKASTSDQLYTISSWIADWATAEPSKFQKKADDDKDKDSPSPHGGHGMPMMGGDMPMMGGDEHEGEE
jgi:hypothetical protein